MPPPASIVVWKIKRSSPDTVTSSPLQARAVVSKGSITLQGNIDVPSAGSISLTSINGSVTAADGVGIFGAPLTISANATSGTVRLAVQGVSEGDAKGPLNVTAGGNIVIIGVASSGSANGTTVRAQTARLFVDGILPATMRAVDVHATEQGIVLGTYEPIGPVQHGRM